jgi:hypothetical protein
MDPTLRAAGIVTFVHQTGQTDGLPRLSLPTHPFIIVRHGRQSKRSMTLPTSFSFLELTPQHTTSMLMDSSNDDHKTTTTTAAVDIDKKEGMKTIGIATGTATMSTNATNAAAAAAEETKNPSTKIRPSKFGTLLEEEIHIRRSSNRSPTSSSPTFEALFGCFHVIWTATINLFSAVLIFLFYLISIESMISIGFSVGLTKYAYNLTKDNPSFDGSIMDWVLLSFAVVTPISASIGMAFTRRERALTEIASFKATVTNLVMAHASWDWCKGSNTKTGRAASTDIDWLEHTDGVLLLTFRICSDLSRLLTLPTANRGRHRVCSWGLQQRLEIEKLSRKLRRNIQFDICLLSSECEVLKREGLPPNEATRVRQWERFISERIEALLMIKRYRTPQALRSFARCFTIFLPPFYAPYVISSDRTCFQRLIGFSCCSQLLFHLIVG